MFRVIYVYIELKRNSRDSRIRTFRINCKLRFIFTLSSGKLILENENDACVLKQIC